MVHDAIAAGRELYRSYGPYELLRGAKRFLLRRTFGLWERLGIHVTPVHFYQPIPDTRELDDSLWDRHSEIPGVEFDVESQLELLTTFEKQYGDEYNSFPRDEADRSNPHQYYVSNRQFGSVDAEILYSMIRDRNPNRIVEVGSGHSTRLIAQAIRTNDGDSEFTVIDPHPDEALRRGVPGVSRLISRKVQDVPLSLFDSLRSDDVLFIDSSHVLTIGSDVQYEYLEVLPRLNDGVLVHVHDIFLPDEYPKYWVTDRRWFWTEQYLLRAFLTFNNEFEILWASNYVHETHPPELNGAIEAYDPTDAQPTSFWMQRRADSSPKMKC